MSGHTRPDRSRAAGTPARRARHIRRAEVGDDERSLQRTAGNRAVHVLLAPLAARVPTGPVQRRALPSKTVSSTAMQRLELARAAIEHTKQVFSEGAGNQREALQATRFNTYFKLLVMRNYDEDGNEVPESTYWRFTPEAEKAASGDDDAKTAAKADLVAGGNCGEHAQVAFDHLRTNASGERIARVDVTGLDHAFNLIGSIAAESDDDVVVSDPWPTRATATTWADHFAHTSNVADINVRRSMTADGGNPKAVIAAGLTLTDDAKQLAAKTMTRAETAAEIRSGRAGDHPWIWDHADTAAPGRKFEYLGPLRSPRFADDPAFQPIADGQRALRRGARGDTVRVVQQALVDIGFPMPRSMRSDGSLDGIFGSETQRALRELQEQEGLGRDGVLGKKTLRALDARVAA